jgi:hypothetical protein
MAKNHRRERDPTAPQTTTRERKKEEAKKNDIRATEQDNSSCPKAN